MVQVEHTDGAVIAPSQRTHMGWQLDVPWMDLLLFLVPLVGVLLLVVVGV